MDGPMPPTGVWVTKDRNCPLQLIYQEGVMVVGSWFEEYVVGHKIPMGWRVADLGNRQKAGKFAKEAIAKILQEKLPFWRGHCWCLPLNALQPQILALCS